MLSSVDNVLQVSSDSFSAGAACSDGLDVHRHNVGADQLAADGRHLRQRVLHQVRSKRRTSMSCCRETQFVYLFLTCTVAVQPKGR